MVALPLSILAFAAGVYLLIRVKKEYLSNLFTVLAWLVIVASVISIGVSCMGSFRGGHHGKCAEGGECRMEKKIIIRDGGAGRCHGMGEEMCHMKGCKMEGDSCIMDKEACEKMMGKEACDAIYKERGRCIMSKDECMEMCHGMKGDMNHGGMKMEGSGCCKEKGGEHMKECNKKKAE